MTAASPAVRVCALVRAEGTPGVWVVRQLDGLGGALLRPRDVEAAAYLWGEVGVCAGVLLRRVSALTVIR
jgi:hypothetical protein